MAALMAMRTRISNATLGAAAISLLYWICAGLRAANKPFWYDELATWHIARLPSVGAIWAVLHTGADQQMLLPYLAVRAAHALFGPGYLPTRLPALLGFWVMSLGIYLFLKRRFPMPYPLIGMMLPMLTFAWGYAFEARAYGPMLGFGGIALVAWQNAAENRVRPWSLFGITAGLAGALLCHPYAMLFAIPFTAGEVVRAFHEKRVDWPVWFSFAAAIPITAVYPGLLTASLDWDLTGMQPGLSEIPAFYVTILRRTVAPLLLAGLAVCLLMRRAKDQPMPQAMLAPHETAALLGFAVAPVTLFLVGKLTSHFIYFERYGLLCVIGFAALITLALFRTTGGSTRAGAIILAALTVWMGLELQKAIAGRRKTPEAQYREANALLLKGLADGLPVISAGPLAFLSSDFYLPADLVSRLYYVFPERQAARAYTNQDLSDQLVQRTADHLPLRAHVEPLAAFESRNPRFLLLSDDGRDCLIDVLKRDGWRLVVIDHTGSQWLLSVSR